MTSDSQHTVSPYAVGQPRANSGSSPIAPIQSRNNQGVYDNILADPRMLNIEGSPHL